MKENHLIGMSGSEIIRYRITEALATVMQNMAKGVVSADKDKVHFIGGCTIYDDISPFSPHVRVSATYKRMVGPNPAYKHKDHYPNDVIPKVIAHEQAQIALFIYGLSGGNITVRTTIAAKTGEVLNTIYDIEGVGMSHYDDITRFLEMFGQTNVLTEHGLITETWVE